MIQICAWCEQESQHEIQELKSERSPGQISHGICQRHILRLRHRYRQNLLRRPIAAIFHLIFSSLPQAKNSHKLFF